MSKSGIILVDIGVDGACLLDASRVAGKNRQRNAIGWDLNAQVLKKG